MNIRNPFNKNKLYKLHIYLDNDNNQSFIIQKRTWYNRYDNIFFLPSKLNPSWDTPRQANVFYDIKYIEKVIEQNTTRLNDNVVQYVKIIEHEIINFNTIEEIHDIIPEAFI